MTSRLQVLVLDPTAFTGGSKVATESILNLLSPETVDIFVLSADSKSWSNHSYDCFHLYELGFLANKEQGIFYFIRHLYIACYLLIFQLRLGRIDLAIGASGPGVDLALYILKPILRYHIIQLIHGPVAASNTIAHCLNKADQIYYLQSCLFSLLTALSLAKQVVLKQLPNNYHVLENGLSANKWPKPCRHHIPVIFWSASLLKWKGLDIFLDAVNLLPVTQRPTIKICYISPKNSKLPLIKTVPDMLNTHWYQTPQNIDAIRSSCNIFVSSSDKEPFGLSILEAMAAGLAIVIPADGAYWDQILVDQVNCIKYKPKDRHDLAEKIQLLSSNMQLLIRVSHQSFQLARSYRSEQRYAQLVNYINSLTTDGGSHV